MKTGIEFAQCALLPKWDKYTYDKMDCQAFVEAVLKDIGVRKSNGSVYDWRGSNSMYSNYYSWRGTVEECVKQFGSVPVGAFVYMWEPTGEQKKGYTDGLGNFTHVAIYCGNDVVRDSTRNKSGRDGVGTRTMKGFSHITLFSGLDYSVTNSYNSNVESLMASISGIRKELEKMEGLLNELSRG
jgi:hypothetical protein